MKKQDLKSGMLVEMSDNQIGLIVNESILINANVCELLSCFDDDLVYKNIPEYSIIKVSKPLNGGDIRQYNRTLENILKNLLWQRPEPKEMIDIDGVEYELEEVKEALEAMRVKLSKEKPIDPPKKKHVIEYGIIKHLLIFGRSEETNASLLSDMVEAGRYRKTKENAEYSLQREKRANNLEALVEDLQGELGVGFNHFIEYGTDEVYCQRMKDETAVIIKEMLNNEEYEL